MMKTNKKCYRQIWIIPLCAVLILSGSCSKEDKEVGTEDRLFTQLQEALTTGMAKYTGGKGISAAVILSNGQLWTGVEGISHGTTPISADMWFGVGSITKNFTAVAILKLVEEGALHLDDPLHAWLPSFPNVDSTITIRQLLNHTSGLNDIADNREFWQQMFRDPERIWDPADMVRTFTLEPVFPKGTDWNYSSSGYTLLRTIVEDIEGIDICDVYKNRCFAPYGLNHTFAFKGGTLPSGTAHGWFDLDGDGDYEDFYPWPRTAFASGICGEVFSTAEDLARWARALYRDRTVLSPETMNQMLDFHSPCTGEEYMCAGYGLGAFKFNPDTFSGQDAIGHSGNAPGYAAASMYLADYDVCIGIVDNTEGGSSMYVINDLLRAIQNHFQK